MSCFMWPYHFNQSIWHILSAHFFFGLSCYQLQNLYTCWSLNHPELWGHCKDELQHLTLLLKVTCMYKYLDLSIAPSKLFGCLVMLFTHFLFSLPHFLLLFTVLVLRSYHINFCFYINFLSLNVLGRSAEEDKNQISYKKVGHHHKSWKLWSCHVMFHVTIPFQLPVLECA